jgi:hypothetical protein
MDIEGIVSTRGIVMLKICAAVILVLSASVLAGEEAVNVSGEIDPAAKGYAISPFIYGIAQADPKLALEMGITIRRMGGNRLSAWNWKEGYSAAGADWYFVNSGKTMAPEENWWVGFQKTNTEYKLDGYFTIPTMGRVAKDGKSVAFDVNKYPNQVGCCGKDHPDNEYANAGVGRQYVMGDDGKPQKGADGKPVTKLIEPDLNDTSIEMPVEEQTRLLDFMVNDMKFGRAKDGGVKYIALDNEPALWNSTHRGMHPVGCSYDELWQRTRDYAAALKKIDPGVKIGGPASFGWTEYFYSGLDAQLIGRGEGSWKAPPDSVKHGSIPMTKWYLKQCADYEKDNGVRLLDILDWHFYPQTGVDGKAHDPAAMETRVQETRVMWDPTFKDASWMGAETNKVIRVIPLMREWIDECYPGTKTAIGEYDFRGWQDASGGVVQAELLGIFAREKLDFAFFWFAPARNSPAYFGFQIFRNPDGKHTAFGDTFLPAVCSAPEDVSIHAARDSASGKLTLVLINKRGTKPAKLTLKFKTALPEQEATIYEYSDADMKEIKALPAIKVGGETIEMELAPISVRRIDLKL